MFQVERRNNAAARRRDTVDFPFFLFKSFLSFFLRDFLLFKLSHIPHDPVVMFPIDVSAARLDVHRRAGKMQQCSNETEPIDTGASFTDRSHQPPTDRPRWGLQPLKQKPILCAPRQGWEMSADSGTKRSVLPFFTRREKFSFH